MTIRILAGALLLSPWLAMGAVGQQRATPRLSEQLALSEQLVESALRFELDGDNQYREMTLKAALRADPQHSRARWLLGQLQVDDRWVKFTALDRSLRTDSVHEKYKAMRDSALGNPEAEIGLARWCRREQLRDLADVHFRRVVDSPTATAEQRQLAADMLDLRRVGDTWVSSQEVEAQRRELSASRKAYQKWEKRIRHWRRHIEGGVTQRREKALSELRAVASVDAITALESLLSPVSAAYAQEVVNVLQQISGAESTSALVRHALGAPWQEVADAAADALKERPKDDYVPTLLGALQKPLVTTFQIRSTNAGIVHEHVVMQENKQQNVVTQASFIDRRNDLASDVFDVAAARSRARQIEQEVRNSNRRRAIANERTFAVLERTTGEILRQDAAAWWQWWDDYNDVYTGEEPKPTVYRQEEYVSVEPPPVPRRTSECFQAGTTVWTETGPTPIESVSPGDRVVAQNPTTGEVALKPVLRRTIRPPGNMMRVVIDGTPIVSTRGHPFWVNHYGWKMARELEPGQEVHSLDGALVIDSAERISQKFAAYNLIVQDFGTYFVTEKAILVHDNTGRANTVAIVPGLAKAEKTSEAK
jgi:hypothetical protein